jgi:hypothetical protein
MRGVSDKSRFCARIDFKARAFEGMSSANAS